MNNFIRLSKSVLDNKEVRAITNVIKKDGYLGMGNEVYLFEKEIAEYLDVPKENVVCVNSGTAALHLAVQAISRPDDEILVQSLTYVSSFQAISACNAIPVACEINENTAKVLFAAVCIVFCIKTFEK